LLKLTLYYCLDKSRTIAETEVVLFLKLKLCYCLD